MCQALKQLRYRAVGKIGISDAHSAGRCVREAVARQVVSRETCTFCGVFGDNTALMLSQSVSRIAISFETKSCLLLLEKAYGLPLPTPIGQATCRWKMRRQGWWNSNHLTEYGIGDWWHWLSFEAVCQLNCHNTIAHKESVRLTVAPLHVPVSVVSRCKTPVANATPVAISPSSFRLRYQQTRP